MATTKTKTIPKFNPEGPITNFQKMRIMTICRREGHDKEQLVQEVTGTNNTSLKVLTQKQAVSIITALQNSAPLKSPSLGGVGADDWGLFSMHHPLYSVHKYIFSLCIQKGWCKPNDKHGYVADTYKLSDFLKSNRSPVQKPLMEMTKPELEKIIVALDGVVTHQWNKK